MLFVTASKKLSAGAGRGASGAMLGGGDAGDGGGLLGVGEAVGGIDGGSVNPIQSGSMFDSVKL